MNLTNVLSFTFLCAAMFSTSACLSEARDTSLASDAATEAPRLRPSFVANGVRYRGPEIQGNGVESYLGVPFAQAPIGELRWKAPVALNVPSAIDSEEVDATEFADGCMQGPHLSNWYKGVMSDFGGDPDTFPKVSYSEDCLYLNVWKPLEIKSGESLPVFVFIHGGSNKGGWSYEPNYVGQELASRGVIVISIAYRVGVFGFFPHPDTADANFGLLDQIAALQWVQQNIASLNGDPKRVTVAGESSGASNISYLMASPRAHGLFQRAIHQSGGWAMYGVRGREDVQKRIRKMAELTLDGDGDAASIENLRSIPAGTIQKAAEKAFQGHFFDPVVDDQSVTRSVDDAAQNGSLAQIDLMIGSNANEARMYLDPEESIKSWVSSNTPQIDQQQIESTLIADASLVDKLDQLSTAYGYACPSHRLAEANAKNAGRSWVYYFSRVREGKLAAEMGAYHGAELPYVFNTHDEWLPTTDEDLTLTETMMDYWVAFIASGDPNNSKSPTWPSYRKHGDQVQNLNTTVAAEQHISEDLCALLLREES